MRNLLERRIRLDLLQPGQLDRLIVASGGHLRDLFWLINEAAEVALLTNPPSPVIRKVDASKAIAKLRQMVVLRLGESQYDPEPIPWETRAQRLKGVYDGDPKAEVPDEALHSLVRARAVQHFNGTGRFAVPPLVVDILIKQGVLPEGSPGGLAPEDGPA